MIVLARNTHHRCSKQKTLTERCGVNLNQKLMVSCPSLRSDRLAKLFIFTEITEEEAVSETELSVSSTESDEQEEEEHFEQDVDLSCIELPTTIELRKTLSRDPGNA